MSDELDMVKHDAKFIAGLRDGDHRRHLEHDLFKRVLWAIARGEVKGLKAKEAAAAALLALPLLRE